MCTLTGKFQTKILLHMKTRWRTPLGSLLPLKICPKDGEGMNGAWNFCPWDGEKLIDRK